MRFRELEKIIKNDGWYLEDTTGSHYQYKHSVKTGKVTIPRHSGDINPRVVKSVFRQAGIDEK